jgi:hypothetical protein
MDAPTQRYRWEDEVEIDRASIALARTRPAQAAAPVAKPLERDAPSARDKTLSPLALRWIAELPEDARPRYLAEKYARVCNRIAMCWADPTLTVALFLEDYFVDKRGTRQGWPPLALAELKVLNAFAIRRRDAERAARR